MARNQKKTAVEPSWHPNFRVASELPDIKAIRTDFLLNFVGVTAVLILLCYVAYTEYGAYQLRSVIGSLEKSIQAATPANNSSLRRSAEFESLSTRVNDAVAFTQMSVTPSRLISDICESLPGEMLLSSVNLSERPVTQGRATKLAKSVTLSGSVAGITPAQAQLVNDYVNALGKIPALEGKVDRVSLVSLQRDETLGAFTFNILVELKP